tara:strand:+ start:250 stop:774 length:525 start_codon:yes stop_codon:yes gene_type:complete
MVKNLEYRSTLEKLVKTGQNKVDKINRKFNISTQREDSVNKKLHKITSQLYEILKKSEKAKPKTKSEKAKPKTKRGKAKPKTKRGKAKSSPKPELSPESKPEEPKPAEKTTEELPKAKKAKSTKKTKAKEDNTQDEIPYWKSQEAKDAYAAEMAKKGATLPKGFIKDAKANTGH